jgi:hypothetical protein
MKFKFGNLLTVATGALFATTVGASALTAEVARKCDALVAQTFPPREPGNPAAGSLNGTAQVQREYFKKCVANGGTMKSDKETK